MLLKHQLLSGVAFRPLFAAPGGEPGPGSGAAPANDPPADQNNAAAQDASDPPADQSADDNAAGDPPADQGANDPPAQDWRDREISRKHAQLQEAKRREAEKDEELRTLREIANRVQGGGAAAEGDGGNPPAARAAPTELPQDQVRAEAERIVAQQDYDRSANEADAAGRKAYGDKWDKATDTLRTLGGFDAETMRTILAADDPAKVLHDMGTNPNEYHRIMDLPPHKRNAEIIKLGLKSAPKPKEVSSAPAPIDPVGNRNRQDPTALRDDLTDEQWYARRQEQKKARFEAKRAGR